LSRLPGHAAEAYEAEGDEVWVAYIESLFNHLNEANVILTMTVYMAFGPQPEFNGEFIYYFSAYVTDLSRYEGRVAPGHNIEGDWVWDERTIQRAYLPRSLSRWEKRKRKRAELL
jgi:hypothetical protein